MKYPLFFLLFLLTGCDTTASSYVEQWQHVAQGSYAAALSDNGQYAVVSSVQHGVAFWDLHANALKYQWQHQQDGDNYVYHLAISHNNSHVLTADQQTFALWQTSDGKNAGFWQSADANIRDIAVSDHGKHLLLGKSNGTVQHITLSSGRRLEFLGHSERVNTVAMSPNGRYALTGGDDYMAYLWDTTTAQIIYSFAHGSRVTKVALDPAGRYAFTADSQKTAQIWNIQTGQRISRLNIFAHQQIFSSVRFSADGTLLATGSPSRKLVLWDTDSGKALQHWYVSPPLNRRPRSAVIHDVAFTADHHLLTESSSGLAEVWEIKRDNTGR